MNETMQEWWAEEGGKRVRMESTPQGLKVSILETRGGGYPTEELATATLAWFRATRLLELFPQPPKQP